jgi:hypothetical protein
MGRWMPAALAVLLPVLLAGAPQPAPPAASDAVRFAVIGDSGSGSKEAAELAAQLVNARRTFPYTFVLMLGDNIYGDDSPKGYAKKFETPYGPLLEAGVPFYASLGNHDDPDQRFYKWFNMGGKRYYTFSKGAVEFFATDSTYMDTAQLRWLESSLRASRARWKIVYGHHPLYSSGGKHGSEVDLRLLVEPLYIKYGVDVAFAGHEHFYERLRPQHGIHYFTSGAASKLRRGDIDHGALTATGFDQDLSFMLVEIAGDTFSFRTISRSGQVVDTGTFERPPDPDHGSARLQREWPTAAWTASMVRPSTRWTAQNVATSEAEVTVSTRSNPGTGTLK